MNRAIAPILVFLGIAAVLFLSNRPAIGPDGTPLIRSADEYNVALQKAEDLTRSRFEKQEADQELTAEDQQALKEAIRLFESMNIFLPTKTGPYLAAGRCYYALQDYPAAVERLRQAIANVPADNDPRAAELVKLTGFDAHYWLARCYFATNNFEDAYITADVAVKGVPQNPLYLTERASAALQLKKIDEAKRDIAQALALSPGLPRAVALEKLLKMAEQP